jgi:hypothetical protein
MIKMTQDLDFPLEPGLANGRCDFWPKDFYRNLMLSDEIICQNDVRRSAFTNYPTEYVPRR